MELSQLPFGEEMVFMMASSMKPFSNPCLSCMRADETGICLKATNCKKLQEYTAFKRQRKQRMEENATKMATCACATCPVAGVCPVSYAEAITHCATKSVAVKLFSNGVAIRIL
jgi:hypothetical protein